MHLHSYLNDAFIYGGLCFPNTNSKYLAYILSLNLYTSHIHQPSFIDKLIHKKDKQFANRASKRQAGAFNYCYILYVTSNYFLKYFPHCPVCNNSNSFVFQKKLLEVSVQFSSVALSYLPLWPHKSQQARLPCPSPIPRVYSNSSPSSRWCHPAISSSVIPFSSCPQSLSASGSFPMSQLFASGGQSIGVSASVSVLPMNTQDWSPLGTRTK